MDITQDSALARMLSRERDARKAAESLLEQKSRELYQANCELVTRNQSLETLNAKLAMAHAQLLQSEKLASIGQLAAGVAHEINNPVGFVYSNMHTLERYMRALLTLVDLYGGLESCVLAGGAIPQQIADHKREIDFDFVVEDLPQLLAESSEGLRRVQRIVQDLRDFSRIGSDDKWEPGNIEAALDSTLGIAASNFKYKAKLHKEYAGLPLVECQVSQLNQVFLNMLMNASHAIGESGEIWVRTGLSGSRVWVEFEDTGCGIAPEHMNRIFDPFFTTKPVGSGTGLGLALSYGIVEKHHGSIDVDSRLGIGTRFRIWIPVSQAAPSDGAVQG